jgi:hypothetical protein
MKAVLDDGEERLAVGTSMEGLTTVVLMGIAPRSARDG